MIPNILKFDHLSPVLATREIVHEMAVKYAIEHFDRHGHGPCLWLLGCGTHVTWIETDWDSDAEKRQAVHYIREMAYRTAADCYAFVSEAWISVYKMGEIAAGAPKPNMRPKALRDDILMIVSKNRAGEQASTRFLVTERRHGPNFLGPRVDVTDEPMASGLMFSILEER